MRTFTRVECIAQVHPEQRVDVAMLIFSGEGELAVAGLAAAAAAALPASERLKPFDAVARAGQSALMARLHKTNDEKERTKTVLRTAWRRAETLHFAVSLCNIAPWLHEPGIEINKRTAVYCILFCTGRQCR